MILNDDNTITLTTHDCVMCKHAPGKEREVVDSKCGTCNGTGRGPRGGKRGCKTCAGSGRDWVNTGRIIDCRACKGTTQVPDDRCTTIPSEVWEKIPFKYQVVRESRSATFNESYLGMGMLYSVIDYGRAWDNPDDEAFLKNEKSRMGNNVQLLNVWTEEKGLADRLVLVITHNGYYVVAQWN
jgi:hypothetical protein